MRVLVVHQNFPGQFGHLVQAWSRRPGWDVRGIGRDTAPGLPGFAHLARYRLARGVRAEQHPYLRQMESATLHGQAVARLMLRFKQQGFSPDVIVAHPGWGETLCAKDIFPDAKLVHLCEWYYQPDGADLGFDPEFPLSLDDCARIRTWNALHALNLTHCDVAVTPTQWQRSRHPAIFQSKLTVQHEGIAVHELSPNPSASWAMPNGAVLHAGDPIVTYVARNLEPYRGFHVFMRALERIQRAHTTCHAVIVGGDEVSYGKRPKDAPNWREKMLREVTLDPMRTHFLGRVPRADFIRVLQLSRAHVYLSYPFVLSWSLLEAMACGAPVLASNTAPVREVIRHGEQGRLVDFFDAHAVAKGVLDLLERPAEVASMRRAAMESAGRYSHARGLEGYDALMGARPAFTDFTEPTNLALTT